MAFTTFLVIISVVTIATAGYPGWPVHDNPFAGFPQPMMSMPFSPTAMTGFFPNRFPMFVPYGSFSVPIPSAADIASAVPPKGGSFHGVLVSTKSAMKKQEDGTFVKEGGSTILINENGNIKVEKTGNAPPDLNITTVRRSNFDVPQMMPRHHNMYHKNLFDDVFSQFPFVARISPEELKKYKPAEGENFRGHHVSSHSYISNVNGKITQGGSIERTDNDNGRVDEKKMSFHNDGTEDDSTDETTE